MISLSVGLQDGEVNDLVKIISKKSQLDNSLTYMAKGKLLKLKKTY